jgi:hypothetical protein
MTEIPRLPDKSMSEDGAVDITLFIDEFEAYFDAQVIGEIEKAIDNEMGPTAYILISCAIDCLASFWKGQDSSRTAYRDFVDEFFRGLYEGSELYRDLRCRLVHNYTVGERLIVCWGEADIHRSLTDSDEMILNLDQFFEEFKQAKEAYFAQVHSTSHLQQNLLKRWEVVGILSPICPDSLRCSVVRDRGEGAAMR